MAPIIKKNKKDPASNPESKLALTNPPLSFNQAKPIYIDDLHIDTSFIDTLLLYKEHAKGQMSQLSNGRLIRFG